MTQIQLRLDRLEKKIGTGNALGRCFRLIGGRRDSDVRCYLDELGFVTTGEDTIIQLVLVDAEAGEVRSEEPETPLSLLSYTDRAA